MSVPSIITAGDARMWTLAASNLIVSSAWNCKISFRGPAPGIDLAGTANTSGGWDFVLTSLQSAGLNTKMQDAQWMWQAVATNIADSTSRMTVGSGSLTVKTDLSNVALSTTYDGRSQAEQILAAIENEVRARVSGGLTAEYTIGSRSLKREPMKALLDLKSRYQIIVQRERQALIGNSVGFGGGRLGVSFK